MKRRICSLLTALILCTGLAAALLPPAAASSDGSGDESAATPRPSFTAVSDSFAEDKWQLILNEPVLFHRRSFTDSKTGLYIQYNLYLPDGYDPAGSYPLVLFLADSGSTGRDPTLPLTQGIGGLVWAAPAWQEAFPTIVAVPVYREEILDHEYGFTTTGYVELTKNLVAHLCEEYAVDSDRIYGTGQGMGCEALLSIAGKNPKLFTACMFVSGQWNVKRLSSLEQQKFIFFASEDDTGVYRFANQLMDRFAADGVGFAYSVWDGNWEPNERTLAGLKLTVSSTGHYFVLWRSGTVVPDNEDLKQAEKLGGETADGIHVASFQCAYRCVALMEWMFGQKKPPDGDVVK